jgi:hypothetical protein
VVTLPKKPSLVRISKNNVANKKCLKKPSNISRLRMLAKELSKKQRKFVLVVRGKK